MLSDDLSQDSENSEAADSPSVSAAPLALEHEVPESDAVEEVAVPPSPPAKGDRDVQEEAVLHARAYQVEMFEESLKQNIIVAMDTGSGKTQIAVLRMQAELERSPPGKLIWFLTPTVALCYQQFNVITSQIPGVLTKMLSGNDGPETWSTPQIWDAFLDNVSIVVSTVQVLSDALQHGFLRMERLSLIIFDEGTVSPLPMSSRKLTFSAHNCVGRNPGSKVMDIYQRTKKACLDVPAILGLSASPVMNTSRDSLETIERTLDAICKTPIKHRGELLSQVNRPNLVCVFYESTTETGTATSTHSMESLQHTRNTLDIKRDPYVKNKLVENTERSRNQLRDAIQKQSTPSIRQISSLCRKSVELRCELGPWAADYFIYTTITQFLGSLNKSEICLGAWELAERKYLADNLKRVQLPDQAINGDIVVTDKVLKLLEYLLGCPENTLGIIFVKETATVSVLHNLLTSHPSTQHRFRIGTMVGISRHVSRTRDIGEMGREDSLLNLERFRSGKLDLLIATNVLEEGIDVPACNLVICFDRPANLKSFIQRRGRARRKDSELVLFCEMGSETQNTWEWLEEDMKKKYEAEGREKKELSELEDSTNDYSPRFATSRGNEMDIDHAKAHLDHFCATLFARQFVECRPYYLFQRTYTTRAKANPPLIRATVVLPNSLPPHLRRIDGACAWYSERKACRDAAFEAYKKLYEAGLVNEHLLPFRDDELVDGPDLRLSEDEVSERWDPWPRVARAWDTPKRSRHAVRLSDDNGTELCRFELSLPTSIPWIPPFNVFWNRRPWLLEILPIPESTIQSSQGVADDAEETMALVSLALGHRLSIKEGGQHVLRFHSVAADSLEAQKITAQQLGSHELSTDLAKTDPLPYLIRNTVNGAPYFYDKWLASKPSLDLIQKRLPSYYERFIDEQGAEGPWLALRNWPRRRDFLHEMMQDHNAQRVSEKPYQTVWPVSCCRVDSTPIVNVQFGSLIPSITHVIEIHLVAQELSNTVLKDLGFRDISLLVTAISASSAREKDDYQRLEFLGDVLLKLLSTVSVAVNHPQFPEGYLSKKRTKMVSNSRLCQSTKATGIDKFILTKEFTGHKWQPLYVNELVGLQEISGTRRMSTKVLADIVESLTGACFQDGGMGKPGMDKALQCLSLLIPDNKWHNLDDGRHALLALKEPKSEVPSNLALFEQLLGYSFTNKSLLLEALTHGSYNLGTSTDRSYERLEFIGDAILDHVVVLKLWERNLPHSMMSPLRAACVNADLLGFLGMEWSISQETTEIIDGRPVVSSVDFQFWKFMRHASSEIGALQRATEERHALERGPILDAIRESSTYPWALLAHLHIPKFFSDIFESVIGAVWLDSGNLDDCKNIVERLQILPYLERILNDNVDVIHPKNKLGEMAGQKKVRYEVEQDQEVGAGPTAYLTCKVFVGDELVTKVGEGLHKDEVITKAAERACRELQGRNQEQSNETAMDVDG
ncbi:putative Dicer-like protein 2 [Seiridium cardinale]